MRSLGKLLFRFGADTSEFDRKLSDSEKQILGFGKRMGKMGRTLSLGLTAPIAAVGGVTLKVAADFETGMNRVQALSGATGAQLKSLQAQAKELGATTQFSASQAADAMGYLAMAGFKTDQILGAMPSTLQLAAAAQMDLGRAADITSNILTGYGLQVSELGHANDVLVKAFTRTNTDLSQLGEAFKYAGPVARGAGVAFEEAAAALGLMGNAGIQGSMAGTSLRGALTRLLKPTAEVTTTLRRLGVNVKDANGQLLPLVDIVEQLERRGATTSDMMALFGQRAGPAMAALVDQGSVALREMTKELKEAEGTAGRIAESQMKGLSGALKELRSAVEGLMLATADDGALGWVTSGVKGVASLTRGLGDLNPMILKIGAGLAGIVALGGPTLMFMGAMTKAVVTLNAAWAAGGMLKLASMVMVGGPLLLGLGALATVFLAISANAKKADASITAFRGRLVGMDKAGLEKEKEALAQQARTIEAQARNARKFGNERLAQDAERRLAKVKEAGLAVVAALNEIRNAEGSSTTPNLRGEGDGGGDGSDAIKGLQDRVKVLTGLYEQMSARGQSVSGVLREIASLHTEIERVIRREGDAFSETRAEALKMASELEKILFPKGKPQLAMPAKVNRSAYSIATGQTYDPEVMRQARASFVEPRMFAVSSPVQRVDRGASLRDAFGEGFLGPQSDRSKLGFGDRGFLKLLDGAEKAGSALRGLPKSIGGLGLDLLRVFSPLSIVSEMLSGAFQAMAPTIDALREPVRVVAEVFGKAIAPVLKALFPVFKLTAVAATYVGEVFFKVSAGILDAVGWLVRSIGKLLDKIPGVSGKSLISLGQGMVDMASGFREGADALKEGREEIRGLEWNELSEKSEKFSEALTNIPTGIKSLAAYRYEATGAGGMTGAAGGAAAVRPSNPVNVDTVNLSIQAGTRSARELVREMYDQLGKVAREKRNAGAADDFVLALAEAI